MRKRNTSVFIRVYGVLDELFIYLSHDRCTQSCDLVTGDTVNKSFTVFLLLYTIVLSHHSFQYSER